MQDREFEKQVNQKMQELRFAPQPEIWARVQADLQKKKRRRPVIIWFLFGVLLIGGFTALYEIRKENVVEHSSVKPKHDVISNTKREEVVIAQKQTQKKSSPAWKATLSHTTSSTTTSTSSISTGQPISTSSETISETIVSLEEKNQSRPNEQKDPAQQDSASKQAGIAMKNKPVKKKSRWEFGITAGAGISDVGSQLFKGSRVADFAYTSNVGPSYTPHSPSEVNAGAAFQMGTYVSKGIGKRFGVKLGLNYEYYSTSIRVGSKYNSPRVVNQGTTMKMVDAYYTTGTDARYTNKYHFVSLPVNLQLRLAGNKKYSIIWENGVSLSRLISATALHYDGISGTYYKDNDLFKKTQWAVSSALLLNIKSKNLQLYAGPHVQYGLTNLVSGNESHMRYAGLKLAAGFNKK